MGAIALSIGVIAVSALLMPALAGLALVIASLAMRRSPRTRATAAPRPVATGHRDGVRTVGEYVAQLGRLSQAEKTASSGAITSC